MHGTLPSNPRREIDETRKFTRRGDGTRAGLIIRHVRHSPFARRLHCAALIVNDVLAIGDSPETVERRCLSVNGRRNVPYYDHCLRDVAPSNVTRRSIPRRPALLGLTVSPEHPQQ